MAKRIAVIDKSCVYGKDEWWCMWFSCPKCKKHQITYDFNYCPDCGIKLEWESNLED